MKNINKNRVFRFNRRIRNQTDYKQRLGFLKSKLVRVVIRKSNNNTLVQFLESSLSSQDKVITSAKSNILKKEFKVDIHSGNIVSAYLTGYISGLRFLKNSKSKKECIVDFGLQKKMIGGRLFSAVKGIIDSGVKLKCSDGVFPSEDRLLGKHLKDKSVSTKIDKIKEEINKKVQK